MPPLLNGVLATAKEAPAIAASGIVMTVQQISGATGIAVIGVIYFARAPDCAGFLAATLAELAVMGMTYLFLGRMSAAGVRRRRVEAAAPDATREVGG